MSVSSDLSVIAPQFDSVANRNEFIAFAELQVNISWFNIKSDLATAYLAAHLISVNPSTGSGGAADGIIVSKREGDLAVSYANMGSMADEDLSRTTYGKQFLSLQKQGNVFMGVTGGNDVSISG
jgi:hypothetical protein